MFQKPLILIEFFDFKCLNVLIKKGEVNRNYRIFFIWTGEKLIVYLKFIPSSNFWYRIAKGTIVFINVWKRIKNHQPCSSKLFCLQKCWNIAPGNIRYRKTQYSNLKDQYQLVNPVRIYSSFNFFPKWKYSRLSLTIPVFTGNSKNGMVTMENGWIMWELSCMK